MANEQDIARQLLERARLCSAGARAGPRREADVPRRRDAAPVVLLQDRPRRVLREIVGLRMVRIESLPEPAQATIRDQREPSLSHLPVRPSKYGLSKEMAVDLNALVRVHATAVLPRAVGRLDDNDALNP